MKLFGGFRVSITLLLALAFLHSAYSNGLRDDDIQISKNNIQLRCFLQVLGGRVHKLFIGQIKFVDIFAEINWNNLEEMCEEGGTQAENMTIAILSIYLMTAILVLIIIILNFLIALCCRCCCKRRSARARLDY